MTLTDEQLEQAARELCDIRGEDPEALIPHADPDGLAVLRRTVSWKFAAHEIKRWLQIQEAVNRVTKLQDPSTYLREFQRAAEEFNRANEGLLKPKDGEVWLVGK